MFLNQDAAFGSAARANVQGWYGAQLGRPDTARGGHRPPRFLLKPRMARNARVSIYQYDPGKGIDAI
jgi:hypothetical protein